MPSLRIRVSTFTVPKRGRTAAENEDRCAASPQTPRFAIADGATESSFAGLWAGLLVNHFIEDPAVVQHQQWANWLPPIQAKWQAAVEGRELPWYAQDKADQGAFASFLGLVLAGNSWQAVAVGDCCLFQFRDATLVYPFPIYEEDKFSSRPWLLGSTTLPDAEPDLKKEFRLTKRWEVGDEFLLTTDALAKWFVKLYQQNAAGAEPTSDPFPKTQKDFEAFVEELRESRQLDNDDTTLLRVSLLKSEPQDPSPGHGKAKAHTRTSGRPTGN